MEVSPRLLDISMAAIAIALALLGVFTTVLNVRRKWINARTEKRFAVLRPALLAALDGDPEVKVRWKGRQLSTFVALALRLLPTLRGADRQRLTEMLESAGVVDAALRDLHARSAVRRARAADLLGVASVGRSVSALVKLLDDPDGDVRRTAARALGLIGDVAAVRPLLATIDGRRSVPLNTITMALMRMGPDALEPLIEGLSTGSTGIRALCAEMLGVRGSVAALPQLTASLGPREPLELRIRAARALGRIGAPSSADALVEVTRAGEHVALRAVATRALGHIGGDRTVSVLRDALDSPEHVVASNAARALSTAGEAGAHVLTGIAREHTTRRGAYAREGLAYLSLATATARYE